MTREEGIGLAELIAEPPPGSKLAAAKEYGIDLTLLVENLKSSINTVITASVLGVAVKRPFQSYS